MIAEQSLAQDLFVTYGVGAQLTAIVRNAPGTSSDPLATFISREGRIESVSGTGSPDVSVPFSTATFTSASGAAPANLWRTTTSVRAVGDEIKTLYENHDAQGRPGRVTEGWRDADDDDQIDAGETFLRRRDSTHHPRLDALLSVTETSVLNSAGSRLLTQDYDSDLDATPNETPTDRVYRQSLQGWTLNASGAQVAFADETEYTYDAAGRLTSVDGPRPAQRTEIDYDPVSGSRSALRRYVNGAGSPYLQWTFASFDARGNPQVVTDPNLRVTEFTYDDLGRVSTAKPPYEGSGDSTVIFTYDIDGNLTRVQFPDDTYGADVFLRLGYDPQKPDLLTFLADSQGNAIVYTYDRGRVDREERYTGFVDLASKGTRVGDATFDHDTAGDLVKAFNPLFAGGSVATTFEYDAKGNPKKVVDENQKQDELLYDALDRLEKIKQIRTATYETTFTYDALSNVTGVTDALGRATDLLHDDRGNLVETLSPDTGRTRFVYDASGNLIQKIENAPATGAGGRVTSYSYDGLDRLTSIDLPSDPDWTFAYDSDAAKNQKGRLAQGTNGSVTTKLEYTQRGDVAIERTTLDGVSYSVEYAYDASGNRTRTTAPSGIAGESAFAGLRPASLSILAAPRVEILRDIEWDPFGPRKTALFPPADATEANTVRSRREINLRGQVSEVVVERLDVTPPVPLVHRRYDHRYDDGAPGPDDPGPNLDQMTDLLDPTKSRFFFYDALDRLHKATDLAGTVVHEYTHDAVGNRASQSSAGGSTAYVYQPGTNRLDAATGAAARDYAHDAYGNRIYDGPANEGVPPSLLYDDSNRLVQVKDPANGFATLATYTYDAFGRRIKKVAGEGTTLFFYDTEGHLILEVDKRPTADASRTYVYLEDELVGLVERQKEVGVTAWLPPVAGPIEIDPRLALWLVVGAAGLGIGLATRRASPGLATAGSGAALFLLCAGASPTPRVTWVHVDPLGTPIAVTNSLGTWDPANPAKVIWRASHEPFGHALLDEDPDGNGALFTLHVRFPGQYADAETGWHYNFYRTYDPGTGRYLEADPIGLGQAEMALSPSPNPLARRVDTNLYLYAGGNPTNAIDPTGLYYCVYSIVLHTLSCVPHARANPDFPASSNFVSGSTVNERDCGDCRDNENRIDVEDAGPIPTGYYRIGPRLAKYKYKRRALTPDPRYAYESYGRAGGYQFHFCPDLERCSIGCIATPDIDLLNRLNTLLDLERGRNELTVLP